MNYNKCVGAIINRPLINNVGAIIKPFKAKPLLIITAAALMMLLCSCSAAARDIDNVDLCRTLGIERTGKGVRIYAEGKELQTIEAKTVSEGIATLSANENKPLFFSHVERVVLDVGAWEGGEGLNFLLHDPDLRLGTNLYLCNNVGEMFGAQGLTDYLETQERYYSVLSVSRPTTAGEALSGLENSVLVPTIVMRGDSPTVEGFIYINEGRIESLLDAGAAMGANILKNRLKTAHVTAGGTTYKLTKAKVKGRDALRIKVTAEVSETRGEPDTGALKELLGAYIFAAQVSMDDEKPFELEINVK